jgi:hypothetical protein
VPRQTSAERCEAVADAMAVEAHHRSCVTAAKAHRPPQTGRIDRVTFPAKTGSILGRSALAKCTRADHAREVQRHWRLPARPTVELVRVKCDRRQTAACSVRSRLARAGKRGFGPRSHSTLADAEQHSKTFAERYQDPSRTTLQQAWTRSFRQMVAAAPRRRGRFILWWSAIFTQATRGRGNDLSVRTKRQICGCSSMHFTFSSSRLINAVLS